MYEDRVQTTRCHPALFMFLVLAWRHRGHNIATVSNYTIDIVIEKICTQWKGSPANCKQKFSQIFVHCKRMLGRIKNSSFMVFSEVVYIITNMLSYCCWTSFNIYMAFCCGSNKKPCTKVWVRGSVKACDWFPQPHLVIITSLNSLTCLQLQSIKLVDLKWLQL